MSRFSQDSDFSKESRFSGLRGLNGLGRLLGELERLVIPIACPGCGFRDVRLCQPCGAWLNGPLQRVEKQIPRLDDLTDNLPMPVWALGDYTGPARGMVVSWKDRGREDLTRIYSAAAAGALRQHRATKLFPRVDAVVPMPSSAASVRQRGRDHLAPVAGAVAEVLQAPMVRALTKKSSRDQVGLSARARGEAEIRVRQPFPVLRSQALLTTRNGQLLPGSRVLLFDDVVTTGATLARARDALVAQGLDVVGALVLAATPPQTKGPKTDKARHGENVSPRV